MDSTQSRQHRRSTWQNIVDWTGKRRLLLVLTPLILLFLLFLVIPIVSLFLRITPEAFFESLANPVVIDALILSLGTATVSTCIVILMGTPLSYLNARATYRGKEIVDTLVDLPIVMPPAVAGIALLMAFGRRGVIGRYLDMWGVQVAFTTFAVILAQVFVASPFFIRQARASFEAVDRTYEDAARTLGAGRLRVFFRVTVPLAWAGLVSGAILTFARALGNSGRPSCCRHFQGRTQTMPLAIYTTMQGDLNDAISLAIILVIISFAVILIVKYLTRRQFRC